MIGVLTPLPFVSSEVEKRLCAGFSTSLEPNGGMVQAATSINEQTLSFIPKIIVVGGMLALFGGSIMVLIADFTREIFERIPDLLQ